CHILTTPLLPSSTLFPYTTLFRSHRIRGEHIGGAQQHHARARFRGRGRGGLPVPAHGAEEVVGVGRVLVHLGVAGVAVPARRGGDRKSTRLNSSHVKISYAVFCLK